MPYNIWQLRGIHCYKEASDVESAPRTVPKTSCEPEQLSCGEAQHRACSSEEIWAGKKVVKMTLKEPPSKQPNNQPCSSGALHPCGSRRLDLISPTCQKNTKQTVIHTANFPIAITMVYSPPVFVMNYRGFH